jgi:hypothetical protein
MKVRRGVASVVVLVGVVLLLQFVPQPASATSYTLNGSADCVALGGVWTLGCVFSSLTVAAGDSLTIGPGVVAEFTSSLTVDGSVDNLGGILIDPSSYLTINGHVDNEELLDNYGTLTINPGASLFNAASALDLFNEAGANLNDLSYMENNGSAPIINHGTMAVGPSGGLDNYGNIASDGDITVYGAFYNSGGLVNDGGLNEAPGALVSTTGTLDNLGTINVTSEFDNYGTLSSMSSSVVTIGSGGGLGYLGNAGSIMNLGSYAVTASGELDNYADLDNTGGAVSNIGVVLNECGATVENAAGVTPNPVAFIPCAPNLLSITGSTIDAVTLGGNANLYSGGGSPLLISLFEGSTPLGSNITTDAAGDWSITTPPLAAGLHVLYATATDVQSFVSSESSPVNVAIVVSTITAVSCSPTPLDVGTPTSCTATVTEQGLGPATTPTGTVDWSDPGGVFTPTSCTLTSNGVSGQAACKTSYVPGSGSEGSSITIQGTYGGDIYYGGSSATYSISSTQLASTTSFGCTPSLLVNVPSTCTATVTDVPGSANIFPGSTVTWTSSNLGTFGSGGVCTLSEVTPHSSRCSVTYTPASGGEGSHLIEASYGGDVDHTGSSQSATFSAAHRSDATTLTCVPNPDAVNQKTTCTAVVKDTTVLGSPLTPGGTVSFSATGSGSFSQASCVLVSGTCSVTYTPNPGSEGTHTLTGTYSGDVDHPTSSGTNHLTVSERTVSVGVVCTPPFKHGSSVSCTITVKDTSSGAALTPKGKVTVTISGPHGTASTHTCTLGGSGGMATCGIKFTPGSVGSYSLKAAYPGDPNHFADAATVALVVT